jgi:hypothetical protein
MGRRRPANVLKATGAGERDTCQNGVSDQTNGTLTAFAKLTECVS